MAVKFDPVLGMVRESDTGLSNLVEDTSPQLGGSLDAQENDIDNVGDITHDDATASDWTLKNEGQDKDIIFSGNDGGEQKEIMKLDVSEGQLSGLLKAVAGVLTPAVSGTDYGEAYTDERVVGVNPQAGTTYTFAATDAGKVIRIANASPITVTVPKNAVVAIAINTVVHVCQSGAGQVTIAPVDGDVIINAYGGLKTYGQYAYVSLIKIDTNIWDCIGGTA